MEESNPKFIKSENRADVDADEQKASHQQPQVDDFQTIELRKTDNPYLIKSKQLNMQLDELEELIREIRFILNKLTPTNMQKLVAELLSLPISDEKCLKRMADVIYSKSVNEHMYLSLYAQICKILSLIKIQSTQELNREVCFIDLLVAECKRAFDTDYRKEVDLEKMLQEVEACSDQAKKAELKNAINEKLLYAKRRSIGNIKLIGELHKLGILEDNVILEYMEKLLNAGDDSREDSLEHLCALLSVVGKSFDISHQNQDAIDSVFDEFEHLVSDRTTLKPRIRFMILDMIDLRKNGWEPRRRVDTPLRIDELREQLQLLQT